MKESHQCPFADLGLLLVTLDFPPKVLGDHVEVVTVLPPHSEVGPTALRRARLILMVDGPKENIKSRAIRLGIISVSSTSSLVGLLFSVTKTNS